MEGVKDHEVLLEIVTNLSLSFIFLSVIRDAGAFRKKGQGDCRIFRKRQKKPTIN